MRVTLEDWQLIDRRWQWHYKTDRLIIPGWPGSCPPVSTGHPPHWCPVAQPLVQCPQCQARTRHHHQHHTISSLCTPETVRLQWYILHSPHYNSQHKSQSQTKNTQTLNLFHKMFSSKVFGIWFFILFVIQASPICFLPGSRVKKWCKLEWW